MSCRIESGKLLADYWQIEDKLRKVQSESIRNESIVAKWTIRFV